MPSPRRANKVDGVEVVVKRDAGKLCKLRRSPNRRENAKCARRHAAGNWQSMMPIIFWYPHPLRQYVRANAHLHSNQTGGLWASGALYAANWPASLALPGTGGADKEQTITLYLTTPRPPRDE